MKNGKKIAFCAKLTLSSDPITNEDILYKYTTDEIRLRVISDLQENYKVIMNIHEM